MLFEASELEDKKKEPIIHTTYLERHKKET